jgi:hypothetical protein
MKTRNIEYIDANIKFCKECLLHAQEFIKRANKYLLLALSQNDEEKVKYWNKSIVDWDNSIKFWNKEIRIDKRMRKELNERNKSQ